MQMDLTEQEVSIISEYRSKNNEKCKYLTYDMEGDHCNLNVDQRVGNHCKQCQGDICYFYDPKIGDKPMYKCSCCGRLVDHVETLCSGLTAMSFAYCEDCAMQELEPYHILVSNFASVSWGDRNYKEKLWY